MKKAYTMNIDENTLEEFRKYSEEYGFKLSVRIEYLLKKDNKQWKKKKDGNYEKLQNGIPGKEDSEHARED